MLSHPSNPSLNAEPIGGSPFREPEVQGVAWLPCPQDLCFQGSGSSRVLATCAVENRASPERRGAASDHGDWLPRSPGGEIQRPSWGEPFESLSQAPLSLPSPWIPRRSPGAKARGYAVYPAVQAGPAPWLAPVFWAGTCPGLPSPWTPSFRSPSV